MGNFLDGYRNKSVLITGGSSGIGRAVALQLGRVGARLWLVARRRDPLVATQQMIPGDCQIITADVSRADEVEQAIAQIRSRTGTPDIVINSAGVARPGYVQELPLSVFREMMEINYLGTVHIVKAVLPDMIHRGLGTIVNISSVAGFIGVFGYTAYGASKFAVRGFTDALRAEVTPLGIRVSIVFPPDTDTPQLAYENTFKPPETKALAGNAGLATPEEVAEAILKGVAKNRYAILPGWETKFLYYLHYLVGPGIYPIMDLLIRRIRRRIMK